jgi:hypothetical protein
MPIKPSPLTYTYLFDHALSQEIGIAFTISGTPRKHFANELRKGKKMAANPRYDELIMFEPAAPCENEVWICKREVEMDDASSIR